MAKGSREQLPHISVQGTSNAEPYTYPHPVRESVSTYGPKPLCSQQRTSRGSPACVRDVG